jgi:membrane protein
VEKLSGGTIGCMARLVDFPIVVRRIGWTELTRRVWRETIDDSLFMFAGTLAYAWLLAIFPFFIFLFNLILHLPGPAKSRTLDEAQIFLATLIPDPAAEAIWQALHVPDRITGHPENGRVLLLSLLIALWAASGGITVTMAALDKCYEQSHVRVYYKRRSMAFGLTLLVSLLIMGMILLLSAGMIFRNWMIHHAVHSVSFWVIWAFDVARGVAAFVLAFLILALIYHFGPCVKRVWRSITPGAVFCMIVWVMLGSAFRYWVSAYSGMHYRETYGSAWWVVVLLIMFYLDALVLLIGAEINSEIEYEVLGVIRGAKNFCTAERAMCGCAPGPLNATSHQNQVEAKNEPVV